MKFIKQLLTITLLSTSSLVFSQTPKNIIIIIANGAGYNHFNALELYNDLPNCTDTFSIQFGVSTYAGYSDKLIHNKKLEHYNTGYETKKIWVNDTAYLDSVIADPWASGTAMATGKKTAFGAVGTGIDSIILETVLERAYSQGKATGLVTDKAVSSSLIASFGAHSYNGENTSEITKELLLNSKLNVLMGYGHPFYNAYGAMREADYTNFIDQATWDSLVMNKTQIGSYGFVNDISFDEIPDAWHLVESKTAFNTITLTDQVHRVLGVAQAQNSLNDLHDSIVSLQNMTTAALRILSTNTEGFALVVEAGNIDSVSREGNKLAMLEEMNKLHATLEQTIQWIQSNGGWDNNLLIVTSSFESGLLLGDYASLADSTVQQIYPLIDNGGGNIPDMEFHSNKRVNMLVPVYAHGAGSELFHNYANEYDYIKGKYINNTDIAQICFKLMPEKVNPKPKNIFIVIGDGMGYNQVQAGEYYMGEGKRSYQMFPVQLSSSTNLYSDTYTSSLAWSNLNYLLHRNMATGSASSGTALATGIKTKSDVIAIDQNNNVMLNIMSLAKTKGLSTGIVTSMPIADATPATFSAHNASRSNKMDIMREILIESKHDVVMGCGHPYRNDNGNTKNPYWNFLFSPQMWNDLNSNATIYQDTTLAGISEVQDIDNDNTPDAWTLVEDSLHFVSIANGDSLHKRVMGVAQVNYTLQEKREIGDNPDTTDAYTYTLNKHVPTLQTMAKGAINILASKGKSFVLMIEGGAIDHAGHYNQPGRLIEEMVDLNNTIDTVIAWIEQNGGWEDNLLIITADHETGYLVNSAYADNTTSLIEANKMGITDKGAGNMPEMIYGMEIAKGSLPFDHTNQLVPFYAKGSGSELFIPHADEYDFFRGAYLNNAEIGQTLFELLDGKPGTIANNVPVLIKNIPDLIAYVGQEFYYQLPMPLAQDNEDGYALNYNVKTGSLFWLSYNKENHILTGTPKKREERTFTIEVTDGKSTSNAAQLIIKVNLTVIDPSDNQEMNETNISLYPNPTSKYLTISVRGDFSSSSLYIYDINGKQIMNTLLTDNNSIFDVSMLPKGSYNAVINTNDTTYTKTFIVQ